MGKLDLEPTGVDVIVPVYGAAAAFARCAASVRTTTDLVRNRLVVVVDGPQTADVEEVLADLAPAVGDLVLRQDERRGFVAAVNRGMAASRRDVVLLNSDTRVTSGWLAKLRAAAYSAAEVATATPFSNDATICSLPRWLVANTLPAGHSVESFGALVERCARPSYPRIPTGVGVCLYIRREVLDRIGAFDEEAFGFGYGEESEFCARATAAGYAHVLGDDTFVFHEGQRSFGASRSKLAAAAQRVVRRRHPGYWPAVATFIREDPLREARDRVSAALAPARHAAPAGSPTRVLHVVHGWPPFARGGTEHYAAWLARRQATFRGVAVLARLADTSRGQYEPVEMLDAGVRVRFVVNNFTQRDPWARNALRDRNQDRALDRLLDEERPELIHVHHLAGHAASVLGVARRRGVPVVMQLQDWWGVCARANLVDHTGAPCQGPSPGRCATCLPLTSLPPAGPLNRVLHVARRRTLRRALAGAAAFVAGSRFIAESLRGFGALPAGKDVHVIPYGVKRPATPPAQRPRAGTRPMVFGYIGALMPHKGAHVIAAAFAGLDGERATLEIWGDAGADSAYAGSVKRLAAEGPVRMRGRFDESEREAVFGGIDVLAVPSVGLESFGLVAREAMAHGVPVLASRRGALQELLVDGSCGALVEPGDPAAWRAWVERLVADPAVLDAWRRAVPRPKGTSEHADEIEEVYREVMGRANNRSAKSGRSTRLGVLAAGPRSTTSGSARAG